MLHWREYNESQRAYFIGTSIVFMVGVTVLVLGVYSLVMVNRDQERRDEMQKACESKGWVFVDPSHADSTNGYNAVAHCVPPDARELNP